MTKFSKDDDKLIAELDIDYTVKKEPKLSAKEQRIITGFEEIQKFIEKNDREPSFSNEKDIFERLYATRLEQIRSQPDCFALLKDIDYQDLLNQDHLASLAKKDNLDDEQLLKELGLNTENKNDLTSLEHVKPRSEIKAADEVGTRTPCKDFHIFKPLFEKIQIDINSGIRKIIPFNKDVSVEKGNLFILKGQKIYVAEVGEPFPAPNGAMDSRLRVIFDNGVESNQLSRSLKRRLNDDKNSHRITEVSMGPLFDDQPNENDTQSGIIYVCRSKSDLPMIKENRNFIHKIGVTNRTVEKRTANAKKDPTYLLAEVEIVASYKLYNIDRKKLENLLGKIFYDARIEIKIKDRFNNDYIPREWYFVSLDIIKEAVDKIKDGSITEYKYSKQSGRLIKS